MSRELVPVQPAFEAEVYDAGREIFVEAEFIDVLPEGGTEVSTPLGEEDEEALAQGIASVFESLIAEAGEDEGTEANGEAANDDDPTVALLAELNRLWAEPLAA